MNQTQPKRLSSIFRHEGEYTFQHGYFYRPVMYKEAPAPAELPAPAQDN